MNIRKCLVATAHVQQKHNSRTRQTWYDNTRFNGYKKN